MMRDKQYIIAGLRVYEWGNLVGDTLGGDLLQKTRQWRSTRQCWSLCVLWVSIKRNPILSTPWNKVCWPIACLLLESWFYLPRLCSFMSIFHTAELLHAVRSKSICNLDLKSLDNRFRVGYFCGSGLWQALHSKLLVWIQVTIVDRVRYVACIWLATWYLMGFALRRHCPTVLYC